MRGRVVFQPVNHRPRYSALRHRANARFAQRGATRLIDKTSLPPERELNNYFGGFHEATQCIDRGRSQRLVLSILDTRLSVIDQVGAVLSHRFMGFDFDARVTGDQDLLAVRGHLRFAILSAADFISTLGLQS